MARHTMRLPHEAAIVGVFAGTVCAFLPIGLAAEGLYVWCIVEGVAASLLSILLFRWFGRVQEEWPP